MRNQDHLTTGYSADQAAVIAATARGQAAWAHGGPAGTTCSHCVHYGCVVKEYVDKAGKRRKRYIYYNKRCKMYRQIMGRVGPRVPDDTPSCRHFVIAVG
jgi:hypothetical protein